MKLCQLFMFLAVLSVSSKACAEDSLDGYHYDKPNIPFEVADFVLMRKMLGKPLPTTTPQEDQIQDHTIPHLNCCHQTSESLLLKYDELFQNRPQNRRSNPYSETLQDATYFE